MPPSRLPFPLEARNLTSSHTEDSGEVGVEFDFASRAESYWLAHVHNPDARQEECDEALAAIGDICGKTVVELGAGQGFLTRHLSQLVGKSGKIIAIDNSLAQLSRLAITCPDASIACATSDEIPLADSAADVVVSLANFHHVSNKPLAFAECARILKPGGSFVLIDVSSETPLQLYFDSVVNEICSTGHAHKFLNHKDCLTICNQCSLDLVSWEMKRTFWKFENVDCGGQFLQRIHDATLPANDCWEEAAKHLGTFRLISGEIALNWPLFFMRAIKKCV